MYGRRSQRKRGLRRAVVTLLALVLLVSVCFPGLRASADEGNEPTYQITVDGVQTSTIAGTEGSDHTWTSGDEYDSIVTMETADNVATLTAVNAGSVTITHTYAFTAADGTTSEASEEYVVVVTEITEEETESSEIMLASADDEEEETADPTETTAETEADEEITLETVQAMIDALPDAADITEENMAEVEAQLDAIDDAKLNLTDDERDYQLDYTKYDAAIAALDVLYGQKGASVAVTADLDSGFDSATTYSVTQGSSVSISGFSFTSSGGWGYKYSVAIYDSDGNKVSGSDINSSYKSNSGTLTFETSHSNNNFGTTTPVGTYYILVTNTETNEKTYIILEVTQWYNTSDGPFKHIDVRVNGGSFTYTTSATTNNVVDVTVTKVWEDAGYEDERPTSINVWLAYNDGTKIEGTDATMTAAGEWTYTWEGLTLDAGTYKVVEEDLDDYTTTIDTFTVGTDETGSSSTEATTIKGTIALTAIKSPITVTPSDGSASYTVNINTSSTNNGADGMEYNSVNKNLNVKLGDKITVTVSFTLTYTDADGVEHTETFTNFEYTETVAKVNNLCRQNGYDFVISGEELFESTGSATAKKTATITNTYVPSTTSITVIKKVTGNMGDYSKQFGFTVTDENGSVTSFQLAHTDKKVIEGLTIDSTIYLTESDNDDYKVTVWVGENEITADGSGRYAITVTDGMTITVENNKVADIDTSVTLDSAPYIFLTVLALGGTVLLMKRRRVI